MFNKKNIFGALWNLPPPIFLYSVLMVKLNLSNQKAKLIHLNHETNTI